MVEVELRGLAHQYEVVMKKCRQKRDLCIVCVNYHISAQEVGGGGQGREALCQVEVYFGLLHEGCTPPPLPLPQCEKWWTTVSDYFSEDPLQDASTEAVSLAIGRVDGYLESYPEANVSSLKKIAKHIPDKTLKKGGSRHVGKCHKVRTVAGDRTPVSHFCCHGDSMNKYHLQSYLWHSLTCCTSSISRSLVL